MKMHWLDFLFPPRVDEVALRYVSPDDFLALVAPRLVPVTRPGTVILLPFNDTLVRAVIHEAKYRGNERAFNLLALALAEYLRDFDDENYGFTRTRSDLGNSDLRSDLVLVPVPLGKQRRKERGFNQIEEVAKRMSKELGIKIENDLLVRMHETTSQVSLPRHEREENMRGAFGAARHANPAHTYIIIDDVLTTGATLQAAIDALSKAGAEHIIPLALAH